MAKKVFKTKPQIVLADVNDDRSVELAWKGVPEAEGYLVERYDNMKEKFLKLASLPADSDGFCSKEELNDGVYQYRVSAFKAIEGKNKPVFSRSVLRAVNISSIPAIEVTEVESTSFGKVTVFWAWTMVLFAERQTKEAAASPMTAPSPVRCITMTFKASPLPRTAHGFSAIPAAKSASSALTERRFLKSSAAFQKR